MNILIAVVAYYEIEVIRLLILIYLEMMAIIYEFNGKQYVSATTYIKLKEENRKLKLHIEAKDKAYTALLKDYEELKEKNKNLKEKLEKQLGEMLFDVRS